MMRADGLSLIDSRVPGHSFVISRPKVLMKRIGFGGRGQFVSNVETARETLAICNIAVPGARFCNSQIRQLCGTASALRYRVCNSAILRFAVPGVRF